MADYYDILGVGKDATPETLKRAYRRQARQYHPDVNKDPGAEEKFKEIGRAYETLNDPQKRARYDQFGEAGVSGAASGMPDMGDMGGFADLFETFFSGGFNASAAGGPRRQGPQKGDDLLLELEIPFQQAVFGGAKVVRINHLERCDTCDGSGVAPGSQPVTCPTCNGQGQVRQTQRTPFGSIAQVTTCPTCRGTGRIISDPCRACNGQGVKQVPKELRLTIPAGVDSGQRLRVPGEGNAGRLGGPVGDLYVNLRVQPDSRFQRDGIHIISSIDVPYTKAILGDTITVETVDGELSVKLPAGTQPGATIRLQNKGVHKLGNPVARGDHHLKINVKLPKRLSARERDLMEQLDQLQARDKGVFGGIFT